MEKRSFILAVLASLVMANAYSQQAVEYESTDRNFTVNGVSFTMVFVEGGIFQMGAIDGDSDEKPIHRVKLKSYNIGQTEVTQELWQAVMGSNPSKFRGNKRPVESVSWNDCQKFISKLISLTGQKFRLPTEAEWEFAARGGIFSREYNYSGSNNVDEVAWYRDKAGSETHNVATKDPNEIGIYDMSGNVYEYCSDWKSNYNRSNQENPKGPSRGTLRVSRGGGRNHDAWNCRVSDRNGNAPDYRNNYLGLRLAL